jgi:hypothetical protein
VQAWKRWVVAACQQVGTGTGCTWARVQAAGGSYALGGKLVENALQQLEEENGSELRKYVARINDRQQAKLRASGARPTHVYALTVTRAWVTLSIDPVPRPKPPANAAPEPPPAAPAPLAPAKAAAAAPPQAAAAAPARVAAPAPPPAAATAAARPSAAAGGPLRRGGPADASGDDEDDDGDGDDGA